MQKKIGKWKGNLDAGHMKSLSLLYPKLPDIAIIALPNCRCGGGKKEVRWEHYSFGASFFQGKNTHHHWGQTNGSSVWKGCGVLSVVKQEAER